MPESPPPQPTLWWVVGIGAVLIIVVGLFITVPALSSFVKKEEAPPPPPAYNPAALTWTAATTSAPWETRDSQTAFTFNGRMYMTGGLDGNGHVKHDIEYYWEAPHFNDIWSSADGTNWTLETAHAEYSPRRSMSIVEFKGHLWMYAGYAPGEGLIREVWQSDDAVHWREVATTTAYIPREGQTVEVFNNRLWMIGGVNYDSRKALNDVWYSDDGIDWLLATSSAPWAPRWDHDSEVFNGKMYLASGMDLTLAAMNDVWVTSDGFNWQLLNAHAPWATRQGGTLIGFHNYLFMMGRLNDAFDKFGPNDIWYSADGVSWQKTDVDPPWLGREDYAGLLLNGRLYVFAGMTALPDGSWRWSNDVWVSSP
jgi:hypothetical protein